MVDIIVLLEILFNVACVRVGLGMVHVSESTITAYDQGVCVHLSSGRYVI